MDLRRKQWRKTPGCQDDRGQWRTALGLAVVAAAIVLSNVMITVRIPSVVEQVGHGTAQTAGLF